MKNITKAIRTKASTTVVHEDGKDWVICTHDGHRRSAESRLKFNDKRMFVDGKYIPYSHPLWKSGRYKSFNDAAFSSFTNYNKSNKGYVYIITNDAWPDWIKVGKAANAEDRLKSYQTGDPFRSYKLYHAFKVDNRHSFELTAHKLLKKVCGASKNEWFKINLSEAKEILEAA